MGTRLGVPSTIAASTSCVQQTLFWALCILRIVITLLIFCARKVRPSGVWWHSQLTYRARNWALELLRVRQRRQCLHHAGVAGKSGCDSGRLGTAWGQGPGLRYLYIVLISAWHRARHLVGAQSVFAEQTCYPLIILLWHLHISHEKDPLNDILSSFPGTCLDLFCMFLEW